MFSISTRDDLALFAASLLLVFGCLVIIGALFIPRSWWNVLVQNPPPPSGEADALSDPTDSTDNDVVHRLEHLPTRVEFPRIQALLFSIGEAAKHPKFPGFEIVDFSDAYRVERGEVRRQVDHALQMYGVVPEDLGPWVGDILLQRDITPSSMFRQLAQRLCEMKKRIAAAESPASASSAVFTSERLSKRNALDRQTRHDEASHRKPIPNRSSGIKRRDR